MRPTPTEAPSGTCHLPGGSNRNPELRQDRAGGVRRCPELPEQVARGLGAHPPSCPRGFLPVRTRRLHSARGQGQAGLRGAALVGRAGPQASMHLSSAGSGP